MTTFEEQPLQAGTTDQEGGQADGQQSVQQAPATGQNVEENTAGIASLTTTGGQSTTCAVEGTSGQADTPNPGEATTSGSHEKGSDQDGKGDATKDREVNGDSKRRRSCSGDGQGSPKRPKTGETTSQSGGQDQRQCTGEKGSCARLREFITTSGALPVIGLDPAPHHETLADDDVYRAVIAVTEAISAQGIHQFSFIDWTSFLIAHTMDRDNVPQTVARPGNEMLIPWIYGGHHSLFHIRRDEGSGQYRAFHYDSARHYGHRANLEYNHARIRPLLRQVNWTGQGAAGDETIPDESTSVNSMRQQGSTQCGLHVIFNAWAIAMALRITGRAMDPEEYERFQRDGETLIRQAVQGNLPSEIIWAFFDCYKFIEPDQQIALARSFDHTVAFRDRNALTEYTARVRMEEALPGVDILEAAREIVPATSTLSQMRTADFRAQYLRHQDALMAASRVTAGVPAGADSNAITGTGQGTQAGDGLAPETQRAPESTDVSGTNGQNGQSSGNAGEAAGPTGERTTRQTSGDIRNDAEAAAALQRELDNAGAHQATSTDMQNGASAGQITSQSSGQGPTQANAAGVETGAAASTTNESGPTATEQGPASGDEQQEQVPRTTQLLNNIPKFMKPGEQEHTQFTRERQEQRRRLAEEAAQRVGNARRLDEERQAAAMQSETQEEEDADADADADGEDEEDEFGKTDDNETTQVDQPHPPPEHVEVSQAQDTPVGYVDTPGAGTETAEEGETEDERMRDMFGDDWDDGGVVDRDDFDDIYGNGGS